MVELLSDSRTERIIKQDWVLWLPCAHVDLLETETSTESEVTKKKMKKMKIFLLLQTFASSHFSS